MILDRPLPTTHNETEFAKPHMVQLLEDKLDNRLQAEITVLPPSEDWQHLLWLFLRRGQEPRPQPCCRNHSLLQHRILFLENPAPFLRFIISWNPRSSAKSITYYPTQKVANHHEESICS